PRLRAAGPRGLTARRYSLALSVGRDLLLALVACAAATLVTLTVQIETTREKLHQSSLDEALHYVARHLQIDPGGSLRFLPTPGSLASKIGYSVVAVDNNGRVIFQDPAGIDPELVSAFNASKPAVGVDAARETRVFGLAVGGERIVGETLRRGEGA